MTTFLLTAIFTTGAVAIVEGVLLFGRAQLLLNQAEELLRTRHRQPTPSPQPAPDGPTTEPFDRPKPSPGPATIPTHEIITPEAVTAVAEWSAKWEQELAELRAKWDREDAQ